MAIRELVFTKGWTPKTWGKKPNWLGRTASRIGDMERRHPTSTRIAGLVPVLGSAINTVAIHLDIANVSPHLQRFNGMDTITSVVAAATALGIGIVFAGRDMRSGIQSLAAVNPHAVIDLDSISFDDAKRHLTVFAEKLKATQPGRDLFTAVWGEKYEEALRLLTDNDHTAFGCTEPAHNLAFKLAMKLRVEE